MSFFNNGEIEFINDNGLFITKETMQYIDDNFSAISACLDESYNSDLLPNGLIKINDENTCNNSEKEHLDKYKQILYVTRRNGKMVFIDKLDNIHEIDDDSKIESHYVKAFNDKIMTIIHNYNEAIHSIRILCDRIEILFNKMLTNDNLSKNYYDICMTINEWLKHYYIFEDDVTCRPLFINVDNHKVKVEFDDNDMEKIYNTFVLKYEQLSIIRITIANYMYKIESYLLGNVYPTCITTSKIIDYYTHLLNGKDFGSNSNDYNKIMYNLGRINRFTLFTSMLIRYECKTRYDYGIVLIDNVMKKFSNIIDVNIDAIMFIDKVSRIVYKRQEELIVYNKNESLKKRIKSGKLKFEIIKK